MTKRDEEKDELEEQITENLRRAFRQRADEAIPDRFQKLLRQLKDQEEPGNAGG
jgi:hypothetical protein